VRRAHQKFAVKDCSQAPQNSLIQEKTVFKKGTGLGGLYSGEACLFLSDIRPDSLMGFLPLSEFGL